MSLVKQARRIQGDKKAMAFTCGRCGTPAVYRDGKLVCPVCSKEASK